MFSLDLQFLPDLHFENVILLAGEMIAYGGFVVILYFLWPHIKDYWLNWRQAKFAVENPSVLFKLTVPNSNIRQIEAIEQVFAHIHGSRRTPTLWETWWKGQYNLSFSFEIESNAGQINYYVRCAKKLENLAKEALYAQYPDLEIEELKDKDDYTKKIPLEKFPDKDYNMLGTEYVLAKSFYYPLKTYKHFYDSKNNTYLDPLRHFLETMSNLKQGEHIWYHTMLVPEQDSWQEAGEKLIQSIMQKFGQAEKNKPGFFSMLFKELRDLLKRLLLEPLGLVKEAQNQLISNSVKEIENQLLKGTVQEAGRQASCNVVPEVKYQIFGGKRHDQDSYSKDSASQENIGATINVSAPNINAEKTNFIGFNQLPPNERNKIHGISQKISKHGFKVKIRVLYLGKHQVFTKFRFWSEIHGSLKPFADFQLNSLSRGKYSKTTADYAFSKKRKLMKQNVILPRARDRDWYAGDKWMILNTEEIASLWHFPHKDDQYSPILNKVSSPKIKPKDSWRKQAGYDEKDLVSDVQGAVPEGLPVEDDKPLAYK